MKVKKIKQGNFTLGYSDSDEESKSFFEIIKFFDLGESFRDVTGFTIKEYKSGKTEVKYFNENGDDGSADSLLYQMLEREEEKLPEKCAFVVVETTVDPDGVVNLTEYFILKISMNSNSFKN